MTLVKSFERKFIVMFGVWHQTWITYCPCHILLFRSRCEVNLQVLTLTNFKSQMTCNCGVHSNSLCNFLLVSPSTLNWVDSNICFGWTTFNQDTCSNGSWAWENLISTSYRISLSKDFYTRTVHIKMQINRTIFIASHLLTINLSKSIRKDSTRLATVNRQSFLS